MSMPAKPGLLSAAAALGLLCVVVVATAWQSDDAYITFRTAENLWTGWGLRWNPIERVQSFTSPLWLLVATACRALFGELYFSTLVVGALITLVAATLLLHEGKDSWRAVAIVLLLSTSAAVVDYATSGLENPLLYLLLVLVVLEARRASEPGFPLRVALLTSALTLTRPDAVLFVLPILLWTMVAQRRNPRTWRALVLGLSPLGLWLLFSLFYFGSPVPNTALAKLNVDIPGSALALQGLHYLMDGVRHDPVTIALIVAGVALASWRGDRSQRLLAAGVALYLIYVVRIGGDFMSGRFLAGPAVACAALLVCLPRAELAPPTPYVLVSVVFGLLLYGALWPHSPWLTRLDYGRGFEADQIVRGHGIADERAYYYPTTGLLPVLTARKQIRARELPLPPYRGAQVGLRFRDEADSVATMNEVGFFGYFAGPEKTIIDVWALSDPLLARLQFRPDGPWRIGHYPRRIPEGYVETRRAGASAFRDGDIARLYAAIEIVTQGPLLAEGRLSEIWRLNTGYYRSIQRDRGYR